MMWRTARTSFPPRAVMAENVPAPPRNASLAAALVRGIYWGRAAASVQEFGFGTARRVIRVQRIQKPFFLIRLRIACSLRGRSF